MADLPKKFKEAKVVKFTADYNPSGRSNGVIYKAGEEHVMHQSVYDILVANRAKFVDVKPDWEDLTDKARKSFEEAEKSEAKSQ